MISTKCHGIATFLRDQFKDSGLNRVIIGRSSFCGCCLQDGIELCVSACCGSTRAKAWSRATNSSKLNGSVIVCAGFESFHDVDSGVCHRHRMGRGRKREQFCTVR